MAAVAVLSASPVALLGSDLTDSMLTFETAKLATEQGDDPLGIHLLEELVGEPEAEPLPANDIVSRAFQRELP